MGVMYKLMKHKHNLDMTNVSESSNEPVQDKKITAEHILQLCKFLAEKSKRNKQTAAKQTRQMQRLEYANVTSFEFEEVAVEMDTESKAEEAALPLIKHNSLASIPEQRTTTATRTTKTATATIKHVLASKIVNTSSSQHYPTARSISPTATCSMQYHHQQGSKKDILQKIRSQIMERKRQRQLASVQHLSAGGVWRPW